MMRCSLHSLAVWQALREELAKVPAFLCFHVEESASSAKKACQQLAGTKCDESPEMAAKRKEHRAAYEEILRQRDQKMKEASEQALQGMSFMQRLKVQMSAAAEALKEATSADAGVMSLLQHCAASHAAEVAVEQGIEVKNVTMQLEKTTSSTQVGHEKVVVGYIDAPNASEEEVMIFAEKLQKRCPVANSMAGKIEWRSVAHAREDVVNKTGGKRDVDDAIPSGMPGFRRYATPPSKRKLDGLEDLDELHLPGSKRSGGDAKNK